MIRCAAEHGVPAGAGRTALELDGGTLVATTFVDDAPIIRTPARVDIGSPVRAHGQLRYPTPVGGQGNDGRHPLGAHLRAPLAMAAAEAPHQPAPTRAAARPR